MNLDIVATGGLMIGFLFGILTAFVTKFTREVRVLGKNSIQGVLE